MNTDDFLKTDKQKAIYEGLKAIGSEIAGFYLSGLILFNIDIPNKTNCIMHCLREIDCGLNDFLGIDYVKAQDEKNAKRKKICSSLNISDPNDQFVEKWIGVTKNFQAYAHRHGAWKEPLQLTEDIFAIWNNYEEVLYALVGSFYSMADRLDRVMLIEKHDKDAVKGVVSNLLHNEALYIYFFRKFDKNDWIYL